MVVASDVIISEPLHEAAEAAAFYTDPTILTFNGHIHLAYEPLACLSEISFCDLTQKVHLVLASRSISA